MSDIFLRKKLSFKERKDRGLPATVNYVFEEGDNDIYLAPNGDLQIVQGVEKLKQDILKILKTERGNDTFSPIYGSFLQTFIGQKFDEEYIKAQVRDEIIETLRVLQFINKDSSNLDEQIDVLTILDIQRVSETGLDIQLTLTTLTGKEVSLGFSVGGS